MNNIGNNNKYINNKRNNNNANSTNNNISCNYKNDNNLNIYSKVKFTSNNIVFPNSKCYNKLNFNKYKEFEIILYDYISKLKNKNIGNLDKLNNKNISNIKDT